MGDGETEVPEAFSERDEGEAGVVLVRRWRSNFGRSAWVLGVWATLWTYFWSREVTGALSSGDVHWAGLVVYLLLFIILGALPAYLCAAIYLNRTEYRVGHGSLRIRDRPLPWGRNTEVPIDDISALFIEEYAMPKKYSATLISFGLWMLGRDGRTRKIGRPIMNADEALYLEHRLEELTGVSKRHVDGGYRG